MSKSTKKRTMIYSNVKENKKKAEEISRIKDEEIDEQIDSQINLNDEVFIGLSKKTDIDTEKEERKLVKKNEKPKKKQTKKNRRNLNKLKIFLILVLVIVILILIFGSSAFNVEKVEVTVNNDYFLTEEQIKELADVKIGENIFTLSKSDIKENIKTSPYIESVKIKKSLPNKIKIEVTERSVRFQFEKEGSFIDIDNQGYILDEVTERANVILISGYTTKDIVQGNRLCEEDLKKLSDVMQIMQEINNNDLGDKVTKVDISEKNNYILYLDGEGKIAYLGDVNLINDKIAYIKKILEMESGYEGEIFVNVDFSNGEYPYFREKV